MSGKPITSSQTIGPFPHEGWRWAFELGAPAADAGHTVSIVGAVHDGDGAPVSDAMLEAWSPGAAALEGGLDLPGFRRVPSGDRGEFRLELPRAALAGDGTPLAYVTLFARGLLKHQFCAVFLEDDPGLGDSALLRQVPAERRATLVAKRTGTPDEYRWDLWLQSARETVFFDYE